MKRGELYGILYLFTDLIESEKRRDTMGLLFGMKTEAKFTILKDEEEIRAYKRIDPAYADDEDDFDDPDEENE